MGGPIGAPRMPGVLGADDKCLQPCQVLARDSAEGMPTMAGRRGQVKPVMSLYNCRQIQSYPRPCR